MKSIKEILSSMLIEDDHCLLCLKEGTLNLSSYAKSKQAEISKTLQRKVSVNTCVVALARLRNELIKSEPHHALKLIGADIAVKSNLSEAVFEKSESLRRLLPQLLDETKITNNEFFNLTIGLSEVAIIAREQTLLRALRNELGVTPQLIKNNLAAITVTFSAEYLSVPGVIHSLVAALAKRSINIVEIVSTFTELSVIVHEDDLEKSFLAWNQLIHPATLAMT